MATLVKDVWMGIQTNMQTSVRTMSAIRQGHERASKGVHPNEWVKLCEGVRAKRVGSIEHGEGIQGRSTK